MPHAPLHNALVSQTFTSAVGTRLNGCVFGEDLDFTGDSFDVDNLVLGEPNQFFYAVQNNLRKDVLSAKDWMAPPFLI
jgi:hypothetical protein